MLSWGKTIRLVPSVQPNTCRVYIPHKTSRVKETFRNATRYLFSARLQRNHEFLKYQIDSIDSPLMRQFQSSRHSLMFSGVQIKSTMTWIRLIQQQAAVSYARRSQLSSTSSKDRNIPTQLYKWTCRITKQTPPIWAKKPHTNIITLSLTQLRKPSPKMLNRCKPFALSKNGS